MSTKNACVRVFAKDRAKEGKLSLTSPRLPEVSPGPPLVGLSLSLAELWWRPYQDKAYPPALLRALRRRAVVRTYWWASRVVLQVPALDQHSDTPTVRSVPNAVSRCIKLHVWLSTCAKRGTAVMICVT
jgi:hypothetical protein